MGLSASQARCLFLTAKKLDLEYQAQQISFEKLALADKMNVVSAEYDEQMNDKLLQFSMSGIDGQTHQGRLTYSDIVSPFQDGGLGYRLVDKLGREVIPDGSYMDADPENLNYNVDDKCTQAEYLETMIRKGEWILQKPSDGVNEWESIPWESCSFIEEVYNKDNDAGAEASYNRQMSIYQQADRNFDLRLQKIQTEHKAVETELENTSKVIEKNIQESFKSFSS